MQLWELADHLVWPASLEGRTISDWRSIAQVHARSRQQRLNTFINLLAQSDTSPSGVLLAENRRELRRLAEKALG
jgi:hypothetical protein